MTSQEQRIAIAEACPGNIRFIRDEHEESYPTAVGGWWQWRPDENHAWRDCYSNDPLNDLNAMHEAEKVLDAEQLYQYHSHLHRLPLRGYCATAAERAEAFLRTLSTPE